MDIADPTLAGNHGLKTSYELSKMSAIVEMAVPIFCDELFPECLLLSYVDLKIIMNHTSNEFCVMSSVDGANFRVKLIDANLKVHKVKVNPSMSLAYKVALKKGPAIYPIQCVDSKSIIPAGYQSLQKNNIFSGFVSKSFAFGLVKSAAFNGGFKQKTI